MTLICASFVGSEEGPDGPFVVCNRRAWGQATSWMQTLPTQQFPYLRALADKGEVSNTAALSVELALALQQHTPPSAVMAPLKGMLEMMVNGDEAETLIMEEE